MHAGRIGSAELAELVARRAHLQLRLGFAALDRMAGLLADTGTGWAGRGDVASTRGSTIGSKDDLLTADLEFQPGPQRHPQIRLSIQGCLPLVCQRCLDSVSWPVALDVTLTVTASDEQARGVTDPFDTVAMETDGLDLHDLVVDEVLASLPLAPRHEAGQGPGPCGGVPAPGADSGGGGETHRPFADLGARMKSRARK